MNAHLAARTSATPTITFNALHLTIEMMIMIPECDDELGLTMKVILMTMTLLIQMITKMISGRWNFSFDLPHSTAEPNNVVTKIKRYVAMKLRSGLLNDIAE